MASLIQPENLGLLRMLAVTVVGSLLLYRFVLWVRESPSMPDPWGPKIESSLHESNAVPVCHRCFTPCPTRGWFCENCGGAVGPYNNYMPYVEVFSEGEVFRNGVTGKLRASPLIFVGYFLYSLTAYLVFSPVYWYFLVKHLKRQREEAPSVESPEERWW
jgi:hypothetical protein